MYRRVEITGLENIPKNKQVILVGNHPTAFMEPMVIATRTWWRRMHFMIRGDMWKPGFLAWLMDSIHGVPVYRKSEGYTAQDANKDTFQRCVDLILAKELLIIFAEGTHQMVRRLRIFKKGTARIIMQALQDNQDEDVIVLPISAVFSGANTLRSSVHLTVGKGLPMRQFIEESDARSLTQMTRAMHNAVNENLPQIIESEETLFENMMFKQAAFGKPFSRQWRDASIQLSRLSSEEREEMANQAQQNDHTLEYQTLKQQMSWYHWLALAIFAVPAFIGKIIHWPVIKFSQNTTDKIVKKPEFYSSLLSACFIGFMLALYLILIVLSNLIFGHLWFVLASIVCGFISLKYFDLWRIATS